MKDRLYLRIVQPIVPGLVLATLVAMAAMLVEHLETTITGRPWVEALVLAILLGALVRSVWTPPALFERGAQCAAKTVLEMAIVLMGATIHFDAILAAGLQILLAIVVTVIGAIGISFLIGRALGLPAKMAMLVACGNAICGNSAIAAVAPVIDADGEDVATSIAFTAVLGIAVVIGLPVLAHHLHLTPAAGGILAGLTVYAVPQVMAAAGPMGAAAVQLGTVVKLVRVLMLGPVVTGLSLLMSRQSRREGTRIALAPIMPPFILAFLAVGTLNSLGLIPQGLAMPAHAGSAWLTIVAMAGLGLGVDARSVAAAGPRVVFVVTASLLMLGAMAFAVLHMLHLA